MKLSRLMGDLNDNKIYRFHLAKKEPKGSRPLDALAKSEDDWLNWQLYRGKSKERFTKDNIVSFAQISGNKFLFGGIFEIIDRTGKRYDVVYSKKYYDMIGRLIIDYQGDNTRATVFRPSYIFSNTRISGIYEYKFKGEPFISYDEVNHDFGQMEVIVKNNLNDWKVALSNVSGVYLITDKATGKHYVGSAYGSGGIWARWKSYINSYHGNNKDLKELFQKKSEKYFKDNFKFAVLEIMSNAKTKEEVIHKEHLWIKKLFTKEYGYNN